MDLANGKISYTGDIYEVKYAKYESEKNRDVLDSDYYFKSLLLNPTVNLESGVGTQDDPTPCNRKRTSFKFIFHEGSTSCYR